MPRIALAHDKLAVCQPGDSFCEGAVRWTFHRVMNMWGTARMLVLRADPSSCWHSSPAVTGMACPAPSDPSRGIGIRENIDLLFLYVPEILANTVTRQARPANAFPCCESTVSFFPTLVTTSRGARCILEVIRLRTFS